jgi:hypothetical protein
VGARQLRDRWRNKALQGARIDGSTWHPTCGIKENRQCVEGSYNYYGRLFLGYPCLKWAGMARMIAPCFYAGFEDLSALQRGAQDVSTRWALSKDGVGADARWADRLLGHYEDTFLHMQKKIFEDQAVMHEAYLTGGLTEIRRLYWARIIDRATLRAWRQIDTWYRRGDSELVDQGNRALLFREQFDIIDRFYAGLLLYEHRTGLVLTYLMTLTGAPSIPGARSYPEAFPVSLAVGSRLGTLKVGTPLADGDIAVFAHRWKLTDEDTLPAFLALIRCCPAEARELIQKPIAARMREYRLAARAGKLATGAVSRWHPKADHTSTRARPEVLRPVSSVVVSGTRVVDLNDPRSRQTLGVPCGAPSQTWMNPDLRSFTAEVRLPGGDGFRCDADAVVILCPDGTSDPERVVVRQPPTNRDEAERRLRAYAGLELRTEPIPGGAIEEWLGDLGQDQGSHHYSTRVFTPGSVDAVQLEFQVSHHIAERKFIITIQFTWHTSFEPGEPVPPSVD